MYELVFKVGILLNNFLFSIVYAAGPAGQNPNPTTIDLKTLNPLGFSSFLDVVKAVLRAARIVAMPIASLMIIYGAFKILTAGSNPNNLKEGKQIIFWAIIGVVIVLAAEGITSLVTNVLNGCSPNPGDVNYSPDCYGPPRP